MCGIVGLYNHHQSDTKLPQMLNALHFRGPDAEGVYWSTDKKVNLGHRRLSIIDLSNSANQPFIKEGWVIVFNGEIYNYLELKAELIALGASFKTSSDTEVLLEAWRHWGSACLSKLRGMFVFAIYNEQTKVLYLARDPFGIKPLFLYKENNQIAFASELKALLPIIDSLTVNPQGIAASLLYVWLPDSTTMIKGIEKFPAGHWAEIKDGQFNLHQYYYFEELFNLVNTDQVDEDRLNDILLDSVKHHLIADVPVATFLSGGLDSSLITAMAAKQVNKLESYTIRFRETDKRFEAMPDDTSYARRIADHFNIKLHEIEINPDITQMLPKIVSILDEPIGDAAAINTYLICQAARESGIKVLLSGMGADELFAGYRKHYACMLTNKIRAKVPHLLRVGMEKIGEYLPVAGEKSGYKRLRWFKRFTRFVNLPEEAAFRQSYTYYTERELKQLLSPDFYPAIQQVLNEHQQIYWQGPSDQINRMCYTDIRMFMLGLNLTYTDRASMAASTEVRVPFIDKEVIKASFAIPGSAKLHGKEAKYILKKVAERWLPHDIIYRPKAGFGAPLRAWIRRDLRDMVDEYLLGPKGLAERGMLNAQKIKEMIEDDRKGKADYSQNIWQLLTLEEWLRHMKI